MYNALVVSEGDGVAHTDEVLEKRGSFKLCRLGARRSVSSW